MAPGVVVERVHGWEDLLCKHASQEVEEEYKEDGQWDSCPKVFGQPTEASGYQGERLSNNWQEHKPCCQRCEQVVTGKGSLSLLRIFS